MADAISLAEAIEYVSRNESDAAVACPSFRVSVLRNFAVEGMIPYLKYFLLREGFGPDVVVGEYDNIQQEVLDGGSHVYRPETRLIVVSLFLKHLDPDSESSDWNPSAAEERVIQILHVLQDKTSVPVAINTLLPPLQSEDGIGAARGTNARVNGVNRINAAIRNIAQTNPGQIFVIDSERLLSIVGRRNAIDSRFMYMYRAPFAREFQELYCAELARLARILQGNVRKCLVVDCDNTLWGGVVGEDGIDGIALDPHDYPARCFHDFHRSILNLISTGVIVAICSKNNEGDVLEVLDSHPHSLLRREHIAAWRINWNNKADNIRELAMELNIGLDSLVFVDDSAMECTLVRETLPQVAVLQVPAKPYELPGLLYADGLFDKLAITREDAQRTRMYVADRQRTELKSNVTDLDEYLRSLNVRATIRNASTGDTARVSQLLGKTNQFNLTTRRHPESRVREMVMDPLWEVYVLEAADRFSELGLVGVMIVNIDGQIAIVDSLLMSCRALGRNLEDAFVDWCMRRVCDDHGVLDWAAEYIPTRKNSQVSGFWERQGFKCQSSSPERVSYVVTSREREFRKFDFIEVNRGQP